MSEARTRILETIRGSLKRGPLPAEGQEVLDQRLRQRQSGPIPARAQLDPVARIDLFVSEAERVDATVDRVAGSAAVPTAIATYLAGRNLPGIIKMAPDPALRAIPWSENTALSVTEGHSEGSDMVSVTGAFAGVAETGTLVLLSGPESPTTLNFLPDTHIVVIDAERIAGTYEQVWAEIRTATGGTLPRTVNWITGPSRTADIEQTLLLGAHGPRRLHIVVVENREPGNG